MPSFRIVKDIEEINSCYKDWAPAEKFKCKDRIVDQNGHQYRIIDKRERPGYTFSPLTRFLGVVAIVCTFGLALFSKKICHLFEKSKETVRLAIPVTEQNPYKNNEDLTCQDPDIHFDCGFVDYREPNEGTPKNVKPHIEKMEKGWIVSVGTERSFFDLLFSDPNKCEGLIIRDINPKVKAYCDFLILLLRISISRQDFVDLSEKNLQELKQILIPRIRACDMSNKMKCYYIRNFDRLGGCYLDQNHLPQAGDFEGIEYRKDDALFNKLQGYAREGKIITTVGDINDLRFAVGRKITLIDSSNLSSYIFLNFLAEDPDFAPRLIHTRQDPIETQYMSAIFKPPSDEVIKKTKEHLGCLNEGTPQGFSNVICMAYMSGLVKKEEDIFDNIPYVVYSEKLNDIFEKMKDHAAFHLFAKQE